MRILFLILVLFVPAALAQTPTASPAPAPSLVKTEADAKNGCSYPYFTFVPPAIRTGKTKHTILVLPNNTGKLTDDIKVHEDYITRRSGQYTTLATTLGVIVLIPVFPRPETDWKIYTHALDRDSLTTDKKEYKRFDLQLMAMIDNARRTLEKERIDTDKRVMMMGFSASGMFTNRFTFLHPARVKAAAIGSPGGWPIAPVAEYEGKALRYPIGTADIKTVAGRKLNIKELRKVKFYVYLGDQDDNDSLPFGDGYETEDKDLVFALFGKTPFERWETSKKLYLDAKLKAEFKLYPGIKHTITKEMMADIIAFLSANK